MPTDPITLGTQFQPEAPGWPSVSSPEWLRELQVPQKVIEDRRLLTQFFSTQSSRLYSLEHTEKIKTASSEIHDYEMVADYLENHEPLRAEESQALDEVYQQMAASPSVQVGIQSGDLDDLLNRAEEYVQNHPTPTAPSSGGSSSMDAWDQLFMMEVSSQRNQNDQKYKELLANAKDPETVMLIACHKYTSLYGQKLVKLMGVYREQIEVHGRWAQGMLNNSSAAEIARANAELSRNTSFMGMASFAIQSVRQQTDSIQNQTRSVLDNINEYERQVIRNFIG